MSTNESEATYDELSERAERGELSVKPGTVRVGAAARLSHGFLEIEKEEHDETRAERDAALEAIERVRKILAVPYERVGVPEYWHKQFVAALDGAPEPEVKP